MGKIHLPIKAPKSDYVVGRRRVEDVLGIENAASAFGNTYWKRLRGCPREHGLFHVAGVRRVGDSEALSLGVLYHHALEVFYKHIQQHQSRYEPSKYKTDGFLYGAIPDAERFAWKALEPFIKEEGYEETYPAVERMLASYFDCFRRQDPWRIVAVEETLQYSDSGMSYSARLDLIVEDMARGGLWIVEHKSARLITDELISGYQLDQQILGQVWLMQRCVDLTKYPPLRGVTISITTKTKQPKHERVEVLPSRYHLAEFERSLRSWYGIREDFETFGWPKALGNCAGPAHYFRKCDYFDLCHGQPEATEEDLTAADVDLPFGYVKRSEEGL